MLTLNRTESGIDIIKRQQILESLEDKEYRREFAADIGTGLAFQIRLLREDRGWTQEELAHRMGKRQETISQWENPAYGRYTLNTLKELAAAFDVALLVRLAPFSELVDWSISLTREDLAPRSFDEELPNVPIAPPAPRENVEEHLLFATSVEPWDFEAPTVSKERERDYAIA
jgi:transcriptional regulator with XRE-family HTH domain